MKSNKYCMSFASKNKSAKCNKYIHFLIFYIEEYSKVYVIIF